MTLRELLTSLDENATLEEARRVIADALDALTDVEADAQNAIDEITRMTQELADSAAEIARLREENGRLFRERISNKIEDVKEEIREEVTEDDLENLITV